MQGNPKQGIAREHGTYLRDKGSEIAAGPENVTGDPKSILLSAPSGDIVGTAHVHPNEGKGAFRLGGIATIPDDNRGPSNIDKTTQAPPQSGYFNIVIDNKNIYFYDRNQTITVPRSKL